MQKKQQRTEPYCYFCSYNYAEIDYKDTQLIQKFISNYKKILPSKRMGTCSRHQRQFAQAVKRARFMALIPYVLGQR